MGTDKRERQKANRQLKLEELARTARRDKTKRRGLWIGIGIPLAIVALFLIVRVLGDDDTTVTTSPTTTALGTTTTAAPLPSTTIGEPPETIAGGAYPCPAADGSSERVVAFPADIVPPSCLDEGQTYYADITTNLGTVTVELNDEAAPLTVNNFVYLARYHFFDSTPCHRIITDFMMQCGSPDGSPNGGPGYRFSDELPAAGSYQVGSLAMANSGANTNGSQFFIVSGAQQAAALPANYSLFGKVVEGQDVVDAIVALSLGSSGQTSAPVSIETVTISQA